MTHHRRKPPPGHQETDPKAAMLGAQGIGAAAGRLLSLERLDESDSDRFLLRLSLFGSWTPGGDAEATLEVADTPEGGTTVRVVALAEQMAQGGVTAKQRAALALVELVRSRGIVARKEAITEVKEETGLADRTVRGGLSLAVERRWIVSRRVDGDSKQRRELTPGVPVGGAA
jgi:hypothetical protein